MNLNEKIERVLSHEPSENRQNWPTYTRLSAQFIEGCYGWTPVPENTSSGYRRCLDASGKIRRTKQYLRDLNGASNQSAVTKRDNSHRYHERLPDTISVDAATLKAADNTDEPSFHGDARSYTMMADMLTRPARYGALILGALAGNPAATSVAAGSVVLSGFANIEAHYKADRLESDLASLLPQSHAASSTYKNKD